MAEVRVRFDREGDFLEVIFEDVHASMEEIEEDIFERRTRDGRIVGFSVLNVSHHDLDNIKLPLSVTAVPA